MYWVHLGYTSGTPLFDGVGGGGGIRHLWIGLGLNPPPHEQLSMGLASEKGGKKAPYLLVSDDLREVFSEQGCDTLPPHRPTDCPIKIIPGSQLPKPYMYSMTYQCSLC